jgi:orotidine-5'-phosphate decarboxylase
LCAGIDPHAALLDAWGLTDDVAGLERFALTATESLAPEVAIVKPQSAFYERVGSRGVAVLERVVTTARAAGALVLLDVKRGDIGSTSQAYADAYLDPDSPLAADGVTASPYLGFGSLDPMIDTARRHGAGVFVLVHTSNAGAADVQEVTLSDGRPLWRHIADLVEDWGEDLVGDCGLSSVGAVVGATFPRIVGEARRAMPQAVILLPGVGAQGASPADVARAFTSGPASALVTASRSVIYAYRERDDDWRVAAGAEAARLATATRSASGW